MKAASVSDPPGFDAARLIEAHQAGLWRYLRALGCEANLADDLTQEAFLAVLQRPFEEQSPAATAAYLRRTAYNLLVSHHRRDGKVQAVENVEEIDRSWNRWAGEDNGEAMLEALRDCFAGLTPRARLALELRFRDRVSRECIAQRLSITEHGAKNLMQRAKQKLRECIDAKLQ